MVHRAQLLICGSHVSTYFILGWTWGPQSTQGQWDCCPLWKQKNLPWPKYPSTYQSSFWAGYLSGWVKWLFLSCPSSEIPCKLMQINHLPWPHPTAAHTKLVNIIWWAKSCEPMILVMKLAKSMVQWYVHVYIYIYTIWYTVYINILCIIYIHTYIYIHT